MTPAKARSVSDQVSEECSLKVQLDSDVIQTTYKAVGSYINEHNAQAVFGLLSARIGDHSLRLKITLDQASGTSLTCYKSILTAISTFPGFPWDYVFALYPGDASHFFKAANIIGGNMFYGFSQNMSEFRSTRYKRHCFKTISLAIANIFQSVKDYLFSRPSSLSVKYTKMDKQSLNDQESDNEGVDLIANFGERDPQSENREYQYTLYEQAQGGEP